ncbi:uclacyanin 1-like [Andrographis paniculata]|uniref:uclacyanin 1-like n=1 Tax=Andrographis paniculata TaxID=175694 RepID=UPI0021E9091F|nr:uclacyanin 1-like [Andrographis paniculata]
MTMMNMQQVLLLVIIFISMEVGMGVDHSVGGSNGGWSQSTDLASWAAGQQFHPGDNLVFLYGSSHSVLEVSPADFATCTTASPLRGPFSGGRTVIPLTAAGSRFFICGTAGHCLGGMKLQVDILAADAAPPRPSTTPTGSSPPPTPPPHRPENSLPPKSPKTTPASPGNPALPPATGNPSDGSLSPPPPPSSAAGNSVMTALAAASAGFLIMLL